MNDFFEVDMDTSFLHMPDRDVSRDLELMASILLLVDKPLLWYVYE